MKKNNILGGLALIVVAVILVGNGMGILPNIPWFGVIGTILLGAYAIKGLVKREFFGAIMALGFIAWIWDDYLMIEKITPFPLLLAAGLLGAGLNMIFGRKHRIVKIKDSDGSWRECTFDEARTENWQDGRHVVLENNFNSVSKYVNSEAFSSAAFSNNFGSANIYFNNAVMANGQATVNIENSFGEMNIYFPKTWRMQMSKEAAFGSVSVYGAGNNDMDAPLVIVRAESNFGSVKIYFD